MKSGDTAGKAVCRVEERRIGVGRLRRSVKQFANRATGVDLLDQLDRPPGPDCPVAEQPTDEAEPTLTNRNPVRRSATMLSSLPV